MPAKKQAPKKAIVPTKEQLHSKFQKELNPTPTTRVLKGKRVTAATTAKKRKR